MISRGLELTSSYRTLANYTDGSQLPLNWPNESCSNPGLPTSASENPDGFR
jgi:hypothetical protein